MGYGPMWSGMSIPTFRSYILPKSSGYRYAKLWMWVVILTQRKEQGAEDRSSQSYPGIGKRKQGPR